MHLILSILLFPFIPQVGMCNAWFLLPIAYFSLCTSSSHSIHIQIKASLLYLVIYILEKCWARDGHVYWGMRVKMPKQASSYQDKDGAMLVTALIGGVHHLSNNVVKQPVDLWLPLQSRQSVVRARTREVPIITFTLVGEGDTCVKTKMMHHPSIHIS